jgi:hypothetical protein
VGKGLGANGAEMPASQTVVGQFRKVSTTTRDRITRHEQPIFWENER